MKKIQLASAFVVIGIIVALVPAAAIAAPTAERSDASVLGHGTWFLGDSQVSCSRNTAPDDVFIHDQCGYKADSGSGCLEFSDAEIVGDCRTVLSGGTETYSGIPDVCTQGGPLDGNVEHPFGPTDGSVTVESPALGRAYSVPVTITISGSVGHVTGSRAVNSGPVGSIVVQGQFLWNTDGIQSCPIQGEDPTSGFWHGQYILFSTPEV
jgi:hypothetical protein